MPSVSSSSVSVGTQTFPTDEPVSPAPVSSSASWGGRTVEVLPVETLEESSPAQDPRISKLRQVAIEIGRWASYVFAWVVPAVVYVGGVALAALISPLTVVASIPVFIASCYAANNHAVPAIRRHFDGLQTA